MASDDIAQNIAKGHLRLACYELADRLNRGNALNQTEVRRHAERIFEFCMPGESVSADPAPAASTSATGESGAARKR